MPLTELRWRVAAYAPGDTVNLADNVYAAPRYRGPCDELMRLSESQVNRVNLTEQLVLMLPPFTVISGISKITRNL